MKPGAFLWAFAWDKYSPFFTTPPPHPRTHTQARVRLYLALALTPQSREVIHKKLGNSKL